MSDADTELKRRSKLTLGHKNLGHYCWQFVCLGWKFLKLCYVKTGKTIGPGIIKTWYMSTTEDNVISESS